VGSNQILTQRQKAILIGSILGDTTIELQWKNARAKFDHSFAQKDYLFWKYKEFKNLAAREPRIVSQSRHWRTGKIYRNWHFSTQSVRELNFYRHTFYIDGRKIVPEIIGKLLRDPIALAVWIMVYGYKRNDCDAVRISTDAFNLIEQKLLVGSIESNFNIRARLHRKGKWWNIYIPHMEMSKLRNVVGPYILPSMRYKICPVTTDSVLVYGRDTLETSRV
jgi:hypothetical protein